jgi:hypothetical protein
MIWWFLILGISTLVVVCVVIALYMHLRKNLQKHAHDTAGKDLENDRPADSSGR